MHEFSAVKDPLSPGDEKCAAVERKELNVFHIFLSLAALHATLCVKTVLTAFGLRGEKKKRKRETKVYVGRKLLFYNNQDRMRRG